MPLKYLYRLLIDERNDDGDWSDNLCDTEVPGAIGEEALANLLGDLEHLEDMKDNSGVCRNSFGGNIGRGLSGVCRSSYWAGCCVGYVSTREDDR